MIKKDLVLESINVNTLSRICKIAKILMKIGACGGILIGFILIIVSIVIKLYYIIGIAFGVMIFIPVFCFICYFVVKLALSYLYDIKMCRYYLEASNTEKSQALQCHEKQSNNYKNYIKNSLQEYTNGNVKIFIVKEFFQIVKSGVVLAKGDVRQVSNNTLVLLNKEKGIKYPFTIIDDGIKQSNGVIYKKIIKQPNINDKQSVKPDYNYDGVYIFNEFRVFISNDKYNFYANQEIVFKGKIKYIENGIALMSDNETKLIMNLEDGNLVYDFGNKYKKVASV